MISKNYLKLTTVDGIINITIHHHKNIVNIRHNENEFINKLSTDFIKASNSITILKENKLYSMSFNSLMKTFTVFEKNTDNTYNYKYVFNLNIDDYLSFQNTFMKYLEQYNVDKMFDILYC